MGIYFNTYVCFDATTFSEGIQIGNMDSVLEAHEMNQGYVLKSEIERILKDQFDFSKHRVVVETMWTTLEGISEEIVTKCVPIRGGVES